MASEPNREKMFRIVFTRIYKMCGNNQINYAAKVVKFNKKAKHIFVFPSSPSQEIFVEGQRVSACA